MKTPNQCKEELWKTYVEYTDFPEEIKNKVRDIGLLFKNDVKFLYSVRKCVLNGGGAMEDEKKHILYETADEYHILRKGDSEVALRQKEMSLLLANMIDIFEDILPLGSVVDLKKDFLSQQMDLRNVDKVRVVISKRFIGGETGCYYPYAAVIYPIGMGGRGRTFCFSAGLIEKVVHMGYSDLVEEAFVHEMKKKLIVNERRKSMGLANEDERKAMETLLLNSGE